MPINSLNMTEDPDFTTYQRNFYFIYCALALFIAFSMIILIPLIFVYMPLLHISGNIVAVMIIICITIALLYIITGIFLGEQAIKRRHSNSICKKIFGSLFIILTLSCFISTIVYGQSIKYIIKLSSYHFFYISLITMISIGIFSFFFIFITITEEDRHSDQIQYLSIETID